MCQAASARLPVSPLWPVLRRWAYGLDQRGVCLPLGSKVELGGLMEVIGGDSWRVHSLGARVTCVGCDGIL